MLTGPPSSALPRTNTFPHDPPSPSKATLHPNEMADIAAAMDKAFIRTDPRVRGGTSGADTFGGSFQRRAIDSTMMGGSQTSVKSEPASTKSSGNGGDSFSRGVRTPRERTEKAALEAEERERRREHRLQRAGSEAPASPILQEQQASRARREGSVPLGGFQGKGGQLHRSTSEASIRDLESGDNLRQRERRLRREVSDPRPERHVAGSVRLSSQVPSIYVVKEDAQDKLEDTAGSAGKSPQEGERAEADGKKDRRPGLSRNNSTDNLMRATSESQDDLVRALRRPTGSRMQGLASRLIQQSRAGMPGA